MRKLYSRKSVRMNVLFYALAIAAIVAIADACNKSKPVSNTPALATSAEKSSVKPFTQGALQTKIVTVLDMSPQQGGGTRAIFRELQESFVVYDAAVTKSLQAAWNDNKTIRITFDPWNASVTAVNDVTAQEKMAHESGQISSGSGYGSMMNPGINGPVSVDNAGITVLNTTGSGLTSVIPDMATAQLMFDYITHQCCALPGPYDVDFCISFQYCQDGCYARAHKMCYILNNKYHYATHKVFSFAYPSTYTLSVKGEKWGGCCVYWWYHVAPLVNIKTPSGTKAYVFDPAMFDQPVTLATWLHAQANPTCPTSGIPKVTSFNIQPTASYAPLDTAHFMTDPLYKDTDTTMVHYSALKTCP